MCVVVCTLCCGVVYSVGGVWCGGGVLWWCVLWWCVVLWCGLACGKSLRVSNMRAFSGYTRKRLERTHGGVLNLHTEGFPPSLSVLLSLFFLALSLSSFCLSFFLSLILSSLLFSSLLFSLSLFPLLSSLS